MRSRMPCLRGALVVALSIAALASLSEMARADDRRFADRGERQLTTSPRRPAGPLPTAVRPYHPRFDTLKPAPARPSELSSHAFPPPRSFSKQPGHHHGFDGRGVTGHTGHGSGPAFVGSGPVIYSPGYFDSGPVYADPSLYAPPPYAVTAPSVAPAPPPPPSPTVVEHETGRYELRGDGVAVPYTWVWVPNPPAAPPEVAAPPPTSPPAAEKPPARRSALYTWTDRDGVVHWTDNANSVPQEYRSKVQKRSL